MRSTIAFFALAFAGCTTVDKVQPSEDLCAQLAVFQRGPYVENSKPDGLPDRWIEMRWQGKWLDFESGWGLSCIHSDDLAAANFCAWLLDGNTSFEFAEYLAFDILTCRGYGFPDYSTWWPWTAGIEFVGDDHWTSLDVNFQGWTPERPETGAIRYSAYRDHETPWKDRPPIEPLRSTDKAATAPDDAD